MFGWVRNLRILKGRLWKAYANQTIREGIKQLIEIAKVKRMCNVCMELNPKYCHRRFITTCLENKGVKIVHIIEKEQRRLDSNFA